MQDRSLTYRLIVQSEALWSLQSNSVLYVKALYWALMVVAPMVLEVCTKTGLRTGLAVFATCAAAFAIVLPRLGELTDIMYTLDRFTMLTHCPRSVPWIYPLIWDQLCRSRESACNRRLECWESCCNYYCGRPLLSLCPCLRGLVLELSSMPCLAMQLPEPGFRLLLESVKQRGEWLDTSSAFPYHACRQRTPMP